MQENNVCQLWFRIANLKPRLRDHISVQRQEYRGNIWYVYQDKTTNRFSASYVESQINLTPSYNFAVLSRVHVLLEFKQLEFELPLTSCVLCIPK